MTATAARAVVVAAVGDVPAGAVHTVSVEGRPIVVTHLDGELVAVDGTCPHAGGPLGEGSLVGGDRLRCPWHGAAFDLRTGAPCGGPARKALRRYPVHVDGDAIVIVLD